MNARSAFCLAVLALAACSPATPEDQGNDAAGNVVANVVVNAIDEAQNAVDKVVNVSDPRPATLMSVPQLPVWGKDQDAFVRADIELQPIEAASTLLGKQDMGCVFVPDGGDRPIMAAKAALDPMAYAMGVIANDGIRQRLVSTVTGGFAALAGGMRFEGQGVAVAIALKSRESLTPVGQASSYPANLTVTAGKVRQRLYAGRWICGDAKVMG